MMLRLYRVGKLWACWDLRAHSLVLFNDTDKPQYVKFGGRP